MNSEFARKRRTMVEKQLLPRGIVDARVLAALDGVPREDFLPERLRGAAYSDRALPIECGQTISQPLIVAMMSQALSLSGKEKVLEVGTGSGYQAAILSRLAGEVHSIERHPELARLATERLARLECRNVAVHVADGTLGWPEGAPYDAILAAAGGPHIPPAWLEQLRLGGRLVMPIGPRESQTLTLFTREEGKLHAHPLSGCRFVPLVGEQGWPDSGAEEG